ncbi:MAG: GIN domain-containing protein [Bacteroidia bacterium]
MKKLVYSVLMGLLGSSMIAQTTEERSTGEFTQLEVSGAANVKLSQGAASSVKVSAEPGDLKNIITEVKDGKLIVKTQGNIENEFKVWVTYKTLELIDVSGASYVSTENTLNGDKLDIITSGASKANLDVILKNVKSNVSGASTLVLSGATENHVAEVSGAASLKAAKMSSMQVEINTSGASSAKISVNKKINANASGASSIKYFGEPAEATISSGKASSVENGSLAEGNIKLNDIDTTKIKFGNKKYIIIGDDHHRHRGNWHFNNGQFNHWTGIDLGINGYVGSDMNISLPAKSDYMSVNYGLKSMNWNLNLFEHDFHIYKNYVNLVTGIGFGFNTYQFKNKTTLDADSSFTFYGYDSTISYSKNKLKMSYVQMPLMLEFNTSKNPNKAFHIAAGVLAGYKLTSRTRQFFTINGYDYHVEKKDDYNINPFKVDATVRVGYSGFTLYGTYSLTTLFEKNKGPQLYPFTVGVRIIPFSD